MRRHDPDAACGSHLHDATGRKDELGALVMMACDTEAGGEILGHRRDRACDLLVVLRVRALSEHQMANADLAVMGPREKHSRRPVRAGEAAQILALGGPSFVWFGATPMR